MAAAMASEVRSPTPPRASTASRQTPLSTTRSNNRWTSRLAMAGPLRWARNRRINSNAATSPRRAGSVTSRTMCQAVTWKQVERRASPGVSACNRNAVKTPSTPMTANAASSVDHSAPASVARNSGQSTCASTSPSSTMLSSEADHHRRGLDNASISPNGVMRRCASSRPATPMHAARAPPAARPSRWTAPERGPGCSAARSPTRRHRTSP